ncbi:MAG TPA: hypothetical protein GXX31_02360 [Methanothermobacter sp.]|uniref:Uncharacterized protein n=1 Tax=Methanothermobacter tenebrarum TaxID=680118 RepID=A0ABM7YCZ2_9EURY|nr:hypothetical protein [Methanothermobacter tenebrarum]MDI6881771.1 hypothetical protein [Methanothermobacter sp.]BDH79257.1 hypothetical protein MTTB_06360 [Methanothermobacter tenebrarum]HHW16216.1 hypothetical protein [Methanothermobacter sp.]HOQ19896.1 hypothetical protein [Methanothermobacter sp.]
MKTKIIKALRKTLSKGEPFNDFLEACKIAETPLRTTIIYPGGCGGFVNIEYYKGLDILVIDPSHHWGEEKIIINASKKGENRIYKPQIGFTSTIDPISKEIIKEFFELLEVGGV